MEWSLLVISATAQPRRFPFEVGRQWIAGRFPSPADAVDRAQSEGSDNELFLDEKYYMPLGTNPRINRWHCLFRHEGEGAWLQDLDSRSGTFLNGQQTAGKCSFFLDDIVRVADCELLVTGTAAIDPAWLDWENGAVVELASNIRETRDFAQLPILGVRLRDAGCTDADILNHCLDQHQDPQRCCVLELLLETQTGGRG